jgi:transcriptional regulator with XRE-family HTH domain
VTAEQFAAWQGRMGWDDRKAAEQLCVDRHRIWRWRKGERKIPPPVAKLCAMLERDRS